MLLDRFKQLGLSEKESKVYLAALELGESTVQEIAKKAGINRTTAYFHIEDLIKKGLISSIEKKKKRYFYASNPENLLRMIDLKEKEISDLKKDLNSLLPELKTIYNLAPHKPKVHFFEGIEGLRSIQEDILRSKFKEGFGLVNLDDAYKVFPPSPKDHRHKLKKKFLKEKVIRKIIYTSKKGEILPRKENQPSVERKFIDSQKFSFHTEIYIYGEKIALTSLKGKLIGIIIEDSELAQSLKILFKLAWSCI